MVAFTERVVLDLGEAPVGYRIRPAQYLTEIQLAEYAPMRRHVRKLGVVLPWSPVIGSVMPRELSHSLILWERASAAEREAAMSAEREAELRRQAERDASDRRRMLDGLARTEQYLPATELCNRFEIKAGTLRQWANRGHVRTDTQTLRIAHGGFAKTDSDWDHAQGYREVKVYHVGDTIDRARQSGMSLGEQAAPDAHNALRLLHHAYRECLRLNVPSEAIARHLLNLSRGDDSAFPPLETDKDMGLA